MLREIVALAAACLLLAAEVSWKAVLRDDGGKPLAAVRVRVKAVSGGPEFIAETAADGRFTLALPRGRFTVSVDWSGKTRTWPGVLDLTQGDGPSEIRLSLPASDSTGGEQLSSREVTALPLNKRDFSQLLLLAAGTMTDTNGTTNFTQQFAINGQRGTAAVFAMDGIDTSDPEMGGATFSNFNVDAVEEIKSSSGLMPAEIGRGAAGFTDILTRSGTNAVHGSIFEFVRNAAFDARNFFDRRSAVNPGRIPPFARNEFGFTNGGPVVLPHLYNGRNRTYYFGQYQGFRQVLGTTQVLPVPTPGERQGRDTTAFAGDTLLVPLNPEIRSVLARYPLPNDPQGAYGARTYATSAKVSTITNQFSVRIDHRVSSKGQLFARFNLNNITGPTTNPSQIAIDPSFAIRFLDRQRNFGMTYTRTVSARFTSESSIGVTRTTPSFPPANFTQPALKFADGLYEGFNAPGGTVVAVFGNLFQARQNFVYIAGRHSFKMGAEVRVNRDTTLFGLNPNGEYSFGGGSAYSPVAIRSLSGAHDIQPGDPLPDALTGLLTATPFSYTVAVSPPEFPQGDHIGEAGIRRQAYNFFFQDSWKLGSRLVLNYGLRYELNSRIAESTKRTSAPMFSNGGQVFLINPDPPYPLDWNGWGPRLGLDWHPDDHTSIRAGAGIVTLLPNLYQDNFLTAGTPFVVYPYLAAAPGAPVPFSNSAIRPKLPPPYTVDGKPVFATGRSTDVPPNTRMDVQRYEEDLAALTPDRQIRPLTVYGMGRDFRNGYVPTFTLEIERTIADFKASAAYVGTAGIKLPTLNYPNAYGGADPGFAPYTLFDSAGRVLGGFGPESIMTSRSHSSYHALQVRAQKDLPRGGLGLQASYTFSKSLDDTSAALGGFISGASGALAQTQPQDPRNTAADKGPSTFDITHVVSLSAFQEVPLRRVAFLRPLGRAATSGWQLLNITTLTSGSPFTVYSGVQQTGAGSNGVDRPDQVGTPVLSTGRTIREDYFGRGDANAAYFSIPLNVPGGTGPNHGRFGSLGRNTFRGPAFHNFDIAVIKDTRLGRRGSSELLTVQFRAEFFNLFNIVNLGLPSNIVLGPGFGRISRTAGTSRQIQFSLKLLY